MKVLRTAAEVRNFVEDLRQSGKSVGLVPTMGALHAGHLSLVKVATERGDSIIASLFVNPTQFNNPTDLATYPRKEEEDLKMLETSGVAAVFAPSVEEIYPAGGEEALRSHTFDLGEVAEVMEGKYRPGHFQGVALIVSKLLRLVNPDRAYFGEKDFQQIAVIRRMTAVEGINVEIINCPILRAADGLALSSRNMLLTAEQRAIAPEIYRALKESLGYSKSHSVQATHDMVVEQIEGNPELKVEYFEIVNGFTLQSVQEWEDAAYIVGCITVYCGDIRLIDNIAYRKPDLTL